MTNLEPDQGNLETDPEKFFDIIYNGDGTVEGPDTSANRIVNPELFEESS